ncbi:MAG TPA: DUF1203 domain-containing protein [Candidatus Binatia bacterium]
MTLRIQGIATEEAARLRSGGADANGQPPLVRTAEGLANPCRHCIDLIAEGDEKLVLSYRPFDSVQPYAESGPIFLHKNGCDRYDSDRFPYWFEFLEPAIVRGYDDADWIRYDTGHVVTGPAIAPTCEQILADPTIAYVHVRSKYNCFQCRVDRA